MEETMRIMTEITFALALILASALSFADDYSKGPLRIVHPWSRATPGGAAIGAGYLVIENKGNLPDRLVSVAAEIAGSTEIHLMKMEGGVMKMRPLAQGIEIAPGANAVLAPGGYHLMFLDLKRPFVQGRRFKATLVFEKAGDIEVEFAVEAMGSPGGHHKY
jgi:copper(I)-binding protein